MKTAQPRTLEQTFEKAASKWLRGFQLTKCSAVTTSPAIRCLKEGIFHTAHNEIRSFRGTLDNSMEALTCHIGIELNIQAFYD